MRHASIRHSARNRAIIRHRGQLGVAFVPSASARHGGNSVDHAEPDRPVAFDLWFDQPVGWKRQAHRSAEAGRAVKAQMAAMALDQGFGQAQAEPGTLMVAGID